MRLVCSAAMAGKISTAELQKQLREEAAMRLRRVAEPVTRGETIKAQIARAAFGWDGNSPVPKTSGAAKRDASRRTSSSSCATTIRSDRSFPICGRTIASGG
jgi:hypothetical protein